ncbi:hypothetical protein ABTK52_18675, partial [Acinetobacter baumannii]
LTKAMGRYKPFWWFIPVIILGMLPWIIFLGQAIWHALQTKWAERSTKRYEIFCLLWAVEIFLFFSASDSKLIPYILPVLPPLALLIAKWF